MITLSRTVVPATVKGAEVTITVENHPHREAYLSAMSNAPTAVTIIAVGGRHGPVAQTVSAISSVSADPPTLLACVNRRSPLLQATASVRYFSVSVLAARQTGVSDTFAGRADRPYDFGAASWRVGTTGAPLLQGAVATFECVLAESIEAATHTILLGRVLASASDDGDPLIYHGRTYGTFTRTERNTQ